VRNRLDLYAAFLAGRRSTKLGEQSAAAEQRTATCDDRYRVLFESIPSPSWVYDCETLRFLEVNTAALRHYGYSREEFLARTILDVYPVEDVASLMDRLACDDLKAEELCRHERRDGSRIAVRLVSHEIPFATLRARVVVVHDVTQEKRREEQLRQSQKMAAVGSLAGGVAHDFNNLLTVISGYAQLLGEYDLSSGAQGAISAIQQASWRAAGLTKQLLAFSRQQVLRPVALNLNSLVENASAMIGRLTGENIQVSTCLAPDLHRIAADPVQTEQILLNLSMNARDAMAGGGILTIATENAHLKHGCEAGLTPGPYVLLRVKDTGCGMDEATKNRIFEPFFSTKPRDQASGLGLSTVYGIVQQSGGAITVDSKPGGGTEFRLYFPVEPVAAELHPLELEGQPDGCGTSENSPPNLGGAVCDVSRKRGG
jgi:two-component system, cell cycle sensor histidine kinase and response regulator CckA